MRRLKLLLILATMPEEAWSYVVAAIAETIWPDAIGGFTPESEASIVAATSEAKVLMPDRPAKVNGV